MFHYKKTNKLSPLVEIMFFTLIFESDGDPSFSYDLHWCWDYQPPYWVGNDAYKGEFEIHLRPQLSDPPSGYQRYLEGDFRHLLDSCNMMKVIHKSVLEGKLRRVGIVCHACRCGNEEDLNLLISEMKSEGFLPEIIFRF